MSYKQYQSHSPGEKGQVDSQHRLGRLQIPANLQGKAVLDIGCNEGFFCNVAAERGATRVVGIDVSEGALKMARELYGKKKIDFRHQPWTRLPEGNFDLVIWTSAMHYELDPLLIMRQIHERLTPDGVFILECGVVQVGSKEMVLVQRHDGSLWYPSKRFLEEHLLEDFAFRQVAPVEIIGTDPVPRAVYHCARRKPTVFVFRGVSGSGKSAAAQALYDSATKVIGLDMFVHRIMVAKHHHSKLEKYVLENKRATGLTELYVGIDDAGLTADYAKLLAQAVAATDRVVIIEGYFTDRQVDALREALRGRAKVWDANL